MADSFGRVERAFCCSGTLIRAAAVVLNQQNRGLMLGSKGGTGVQCETKDVYAPYSLGNHQALAAFSRGIL